MSKRTDNTTGRTRHGKAGGSSRSASKSGAKGAVKGKAKGGLKAASRATAGAAASKGLKSYLATDAVFRAPPARTDRFAPVSSLNLRGARRKAAPKTSTRVANAQARLASLPVGFTDWVHDLPAWPDAGQEVLGPAEEFVKQ